ncbi:hypothetical protein BDN70DRAFT_967282 [Pholiota conissans]|uniref:Uncharacterized protein n=1 Tax=Pholiota conissans TaxID=109636 RepID=A0A9P5YQQ3_9AGAR|nr:hypothetical protein BDN70DRAFT_967282 [Pholiota conissans]
MLNELSQTLLAVEKTRFLTYQDTKFFVGVGRRYPINIIRPDLARPYHVPGTPEYIAAQAAHERELLERAGRNAGVLQPSNAEPEVAAAASDTTATEVQVDNQGKEKPRSAGPKTCTETRNIPEAICVPNMSRSEFITAALAAHNFQNVYIPGATSDHGMRISCSGSTGGKSQAPVIQDDQDWKALQRQLKAHVSRPKSKLNTIAVPFDLDFMERYKNRKRALSPSTTLDINHREMEHGSHDQSALLRAIEEIKAAWVCEEHAPGVKTGAARFPSLETAPKKYQNAGLRKDYNIVQKSRNADVFDPFESGGLHDEDITSDRPPLPSSNPRAERVDVQQFPENVQRDRTRRNEVDLSTPWRSTETSCSLEGILNNRLSSTKASEPPKADRGKGQAKRQVISDSDSQIPLPPSARFLESDFITPVAQKFLKYAANSAMRPAIDGENPPKDVYALILLAICQQESYSST